MFLKVPEFYWLGLVGPVLAIVGAAVLLGVAGIYIYLRQPGKNEKVRSGGTEFFRLKRMGFFGILMVGAGAAAFAVLGSGQTLSNRYEFVTPRDNDVAKIFYLPLKANRAILFTDLNLKAGYKINKDELLIIRNGYIETPFVAFGEGAFFLEFQASGAEINQEISRILVGVLELTAEGTKLAGNTIFYDLNPMAKTYRIPLRTRPGMIGAVRIEFLNVPTKKPDEARSVKISNMEFKRESK